MQFLQDGGLKAGHGRGKAQTSRRLFGKQGYRQRSKSTTADHGFPTVSPKVFIRFNLSPRAIFCSSGLSKPQAAGKPQARRHKVSCERSAPAEARSHKKARAQVSVKKPNRIGALDIKMFSVHVGHYQTPTYKHPNTSVHSCWSFIIGSFAPKCTPPKLTSLPPEGNSSSHNTCGSSIIGTWILGGK